MSLINDVLQQLDARVPVRPSESVFVEILPPPESGALRFFAMPKIKFSIIALFGFASGFYLVEFMRGNEQKFLHVSAAQHISSTETLTQLQAKAKVEAINVSEELSLTGALIPVMAPEQQSENAEILMLAKKHLDSDRLTYPPLNNAYQLYRQILIKAPNNEAALAGVEAIKQRYFTLTSEAIERGERDKAQRYIERAEFVGVNGVDLSPLRERLQAIIAQEVQIDRNDRTFSQPLPPTRDEIPRGFDPVGVVDNNATINDNLNGYATANSGAINLAGAVNPVASRNDSATIQDAKAVNNAFLSQPTQLKSDELSFVRSLDTQVNAQDVALRYIQVHPESSDTVRWLAKRLQSQQAWLPLLDLMNMSTSLNAAERDIFRAQGLLGLKRYEDIIGWLSGIKGLDAPELQRILAIAWQQTGRQAQAFAIYQKLVNRFPDNSGLWLALGISADALGNTAAAREGFFRAQQLGGHSKAVGDYIARKLNTSVL